MEHGGGKNVELDHGEEGCETETSAHGMPVALTISHPLSKTSTRSIQPNLHGLGGPAPPHLLLSSYWWMGAAWAFGGRGSCLFESVISHIPVGDHAPIHIQETLIDY